MPTRSVIHQPARCWITETDATHSYIVPQGEMLRSSPPKRPYTGRRSRPPRTMRPQFSTRPHALAGVQTRLVEYGKNCMRRMRCGRLWMNVQVQTLGSSGSCVRLCDLNQIQSTIHSPFSQKRARGLRCSEYQLGECVSAIDLFI